MEGTIVRIISNLCTVSANGKLYDCRPRGKFYYEKLTPLVGDDVIIDQIYKYIMEILPRKNSLDRPMIANVDICLIVVSVKKPALDLTLLDKLLCVVFHNNIRPIICFTKLDLLDDDEVKDIKKIIKYYNDIGIDSVTNDEKEKLTRLIANKTVVLTGQTGAGKSSLINRLDSKLNLETNEISEALGRGVHTTRHVELFSYESSFIADTPGFGALDLIDFTKEDIRNSFPEFGHDCKYQDCMHIKEDDCDVKKRVEKGEILKSRYDNYIKFVRENETSRIIYKK
jgi:ribosome biogenesis GTPase